MIKICTNCECTYKSTATKINRKGTCKSCTLARQRERYAQDRLTLGLPVFEFSTLLSQGKKKCTQCKEILDLSNFSKRLEDKYRTTCKSCDAEKNKIYEANNREKINQKRRERRKDPVRALIISQRDSQRRMFKYKGKRKTYRSSAMIREWLGLEPYEIVKYIESKFIDGMTWKNRGMGEGKWQIDHIIPASLTTVVDGKIIDNELNRKIWHYTNLQPLWHTDNAKKSNKYEGVEIC